MHESASEISPTSPSASAYELRHVLGRPRMVIDFESDLTLLRSCVRVAQSPGERAYIYVSLSRDSCLHEGGHAEPTSPIRLACQAE